MVGIGFVKRPDDHPFRFVVNFRHIVVRHFLAHRDDVEIPRGAIDDGARAARRFHGDVEHRMHGVSGGLLDWRVTADKRAALSHTDAIEARFVFHAAYFK
jgi:hypothetical protein